MASVSDPARTRTDRAGLRLPLLALGWLALAAILGLVCLIVSRSPFYLASQMNSDALLGPSWAWDALHRPGAWRVFQMSRASGVFPDLLVQTLIAAVSPTVQWAIFGYMLVQFAAAALACAWVARIVAGVSLIRAAALTLAALSLAIAADCLLPPATGFAAAYLQCCLHTGGFIASLFGTLLALRLSQRWSLAAAAGFWLLSALLIMSDKLLLFSYLAPACLAALTLGRLGEGRWTARAGRLALLAAAALVVGLMLDSRLYREADLPFRVKAWPATFARFVTQGSAYAAQHWLIVAPFVLVPLVLFARFPLQRHAPVADQADESLPFDTAALIRADIRGAPAPWFLWIAAVLSLAMVTVFVALFLFEGNWSFRYFAPILLWPLIFTVAALSRGARLSAAAVVIGAGALAWVLSTGGWRGQAEPGPVAWHSPLADCVAAEQQALGLKAGIAPYWSARPAMLASGWRQQIVQAVDDGRPYEWGNDRLWYTQALGDPARAPVFNYFAVDGLDRAALRMRFGAPARTFACPGGGPTLWVYGDGAQVTRTFLKALPWRAPDIRWLKPSGSARLDAGGWRIDPAAKPTEALFGPYVDIGPGRYRLDLRFEPADLADCARVRGGLKVDVAVTGRHGAVKMLRYRPLALQAAPGAGCALTGTVDVEGRRIGDVETPIYVAAPAPVRLTGYRFAPS